MSNSRTHKHYKSNSEKSRRKFVIIGKVDKDKFVKYRCNDLTKLFEFLLKEFPGLLFVNVFSNKGAGKGVMLYTWGRKKGLEKAH